MNMTYDVVVVGASNAGGFAAAAAAEMVQKFCVLTKWEVLITCIEIL